MGLGTTQDSQKQIDMTWLQDFHRCSRSLDRGVMCGYQRVLPINGSGGDVTPPYYQHMVQHISNCFWAAYKRTYNFE